MADNLSKDDKGETQPLHQEKGDEKKNEDMNHVGGELEENLSKNEVHHEEKPEGQDLRKDKKGRDHGDSERIRIKIKPKKYRDELNYLKPFRKQKSVQNEFPLRNAGMFNYLTMAWLTPYLWRIYRKGAVDRKELWDCAPEDSCEINCQRLERLWDDEVKQKGIQDASLGWVFWRFLRTRFLVCMALQVVSLSFSFIGPTFVFRAILDYTQSPETDIVYSLLLVLALFFLEFARTLTLIAMIMVSLMTAARARCAIIAMLYHKILKLRSLQEKSVGELVNLCANDSERLLMAVILGPTVFGGPLLGIAATGYCLYILGPWTLLATAIFMTFFPYQILLSRATAFLRRKTIVVTDHRVRLMSEILTCIKLIKLYAWEKPFAKAVAAIRSRERRMLEKSAYIYTLSVAFAPIMPVLAAVVTFTLHTVTGNNITATQAFIFIAVFTVVRYKLSPVPYAVKPLVETGVACNRFKALLAMEEIPPVGAELSSPDLAIEVTGGNFAWDVQTLENKAENSSKKISEEHTQTELEKLDPNDVDKSTNSQHTQVLFDINIKIHKGQLFGICGSVGSGKSSLISATLGQMIKLGGHIGVSGSIAYVSQQAWVMNASLRENILFGLPFEQQRYEEVLKHCCLKDDIEVLTAGDMTEIGERGINLSGGQKQRVSLARAVYAQRDVYLLDDPLSAVDVHVGRHIFENVLRGLLQGKTILFITHQLQYLSECDHVAFIKDGRIHEEGCHYDIMNLDGEYASLINNFHVASDESKEPETVDLGPVSSSQTLLSPSRKKTPLSKSAHSLISNSLGSQALKGSVASLTSVISCGDMDMDGELQTDGHLVDEEKIDKGSVSATSYLVYMRSAGGFLVSAIVLLAFAVPVGIIAFGNWWLAHWIRQGNGNTTVVNGTRLSGNENISENPDLPFYNLVYGMTAVALICSLCIRGFLFMKVSLRASSTLHDKVFTKILRSPMSFFDTTPVGRIINRFAKDMDEADVQLPMKMEHIIQNILMVISILVMISLVFPWFLVAVVPLLGIFWLVNLIFRAGLREIKRLEGATRSPVFSWLTASVQGLYTIHAYDKKQEFIQRFFKLYDEYTMVNMVYHLLIRWVMLRLDFISLIVNVTTALLVVLAKGHISPAFAGLALAYSFQLTGMFQITVRMMSETESSFVAVERIHHYIGNVQAEAPPVVVDSRPPSDWPQEGAISYKKYNLRYRKGLPLVLKGINCDIKAHEKIGIVGRTGSGKSSLSLSVFRLMEPAGGSIVIDGIDISTIGLDDLRSKLSIIPQDPVLFVGTIRYNLDPFSHHTDEDIWKALEKCHLKESITQMEGQLEAAVVENGENFSVGERQLMCMARAVLRYSKILILDEATAAIDTETDALIQTTIREAFADCTLLTIAHRLHTIMDSDRVMVLSEGKIVEFDDPQVLLSNPMSHFSSMIKTGR